MKRTTTGTFITFSVLVFALCVGCAPMTEAERAEREYARIEFRDAFRTERDLCAARGGHFVYDGMAELDRDGIPRSRVWYNCS